MEVKAKEVALTEKAAASVKPEELSVAIKSETPSSVSGGRVLPKEEVSDDVKAFLKTLKK
jgi:hypothetical protein